MPERSKRTIIALAVLVIIAVYSPISLTTAQTTHTSTVAQTTSVYSTNIQQITVTSPTVIYTTTTETMNSTIEGTQTKALPSLTTVTSTYTTSVSGTVTETSSITLTTVSTQTTQILGSIWGESLVLVVLAGAIASFIVPKVHSRRPRGIVCSNCGNLNPPFARTFCVKCGHSLKESS
jgi:ribosomal protein L40E